MSSGGPAALNRGPGAVTRFRIGGEQHGFVYNILPENPQMYRCDRSTVPGEPPHHRLYMFSWGGTWYAIEGPEQPNPSVSELWHRGIWRWMCRHTAIRAGVHHWIKFDPATKDVEPGQDAYLRTIVLTHLPGEYPGLAANELVDHMAPNSDTEDESKGKGKGKGKGQSKGAYNSGSGSSGNGGWSSGGWARGGGKGGKY